MYKWSWQIHLVAVACLMLRAPQYLLSPRLWAEDGAIFMMQAYGGPLSLLWPDQGYLHTYQRMIALLGLAIPLSLVPLFYALAWLLAFLGSLTVIAHCLRRLGVSRAVSLLAVALITLQPSTAETFFTLTNAQWWTGVALAFYICTPWEKALTRWQLAVAAVCCLSGPYSVLMLPVLCLRFLLLRDYRANRSFYHVVVLGAVVQLAFLFGSPRSIGAGAMDRNVRDWLDAAGTFLSFGHLAASGLLWLVLAYETMQLVMTRQDAGTDGRRRVVLMLGLSIVLAVIGSCRAARDNPQLPSPLGYWAHYYVFPYTLLFLMAMVVCRPVPRALAVLAMVLICAEGLARPPLDGQRENLQWEAYTRLARQQHEIAIPVNPLPGHLQGWHIQGDILYPGAREPAPGFAVDLTSLKSGTGTSHFAKGFLTSVPVRGAATQLQFEAGGQCKDDRYIGLVVNVWRTTGGLTALHWSSNGRFPEQNSLRGFYSAGWVSMQFAFARAPGETTLRFDPNDSLENAGESMVDGIHVYCLGS